MKKIVVISILMMVTFTLVIAGTGCARKLAERAIEGAIEQAAEGEDGDVDIDFSEGEFSITDEEGNEMSFGGAEIPDGWPASVPVNNGIDIAFSASQTTDDVPGWSVSGEYNGSGQELYEWYKKEFSGWKEVSDVVTDMGEDGKNYSYQASDGEYLATIFINDTDESVGVVLSVTEDVQ